MSHEHILAVDDEEDILELVRFNLERDDYRVTAVGTGEEALRVALSEKPDLILLDLMLPDAGGFDVCRRLKADPSTSDIPIVMLTARGEEADIVAGLELGAEDYVTKPFSPKVLAARLRAVLRRRGALTASGPDDVLKIDGLTIDLGRHEVTVDDQAVTLTLSEFKLLQTLAQRPGWALTRDQLINSVRGDEAIVTDRTIDVHIAGLRRKLGRAGGLIETVRGIGYRFKE